MGRGKKTDSQQKASFKKSLWVLRYEQETLSRASFADACTEDAAADHPVLLTAAEGSSNSQLRAASRRFMLRIGEPELSGRRAAPRSPCPPEATATIATLFDGSR